MLLPLLSHVARILLDESVVLVPVGMSETRVKDTNVTMSVSVITSVDCAGLVIEKVEDKKDKEAVTRVIRTAIMSKQYGLEDFLAGLVADACRK